MPRFGGDALKDFNSPREENAQLHATLATNPMSKLGTNPIVGTEGGEEMFRAVRGQEETLGDRLENLVLMEAKSMASIFKHRADTYNAIDYIKANDEENFLCKMLIPPLYLISPDSTDDDDDDGSDSPPSPQRIYHSGKCNKSQSAGQPLSFRSFGGTLSAKDQETEGEGTLKRWSSHDSAGVPLLASPMPEISREKINHLRLNVHAQSSRKFQLPVLVPPPPVPRIGSTDISDIKLIPGKSQSIVGPVKRGPMKAMVPVRNMMRGIGKKSSPIGGKDQLKSREVKSSGISPLAKLVPMAQSTPASNRKGSNFQGVKVFSPIPHEKPRNLMLQNKSSELLKQGVQCPSQSPCTVPTSTFLKALKAPNIRLVKSKSAECIIKSGLPGVVKSIDKKIPPGSKSTSHISNPLRLLPKNCRSKLVPPLTPVAKGIPRPRKFIIHEAEKENAQP